MVDRAKLNQILSRLKEYVGALRDLGAQSKEVFIQDRDKIGSAKYHFAIAIEAAIDSANHIIASESYRIPKDNADSFGVLVEMGILPMEKKDTYMAMARFRNRLVHLYWDVSADLVCEYLKTEVPTLEEFVRIISSWVEEQD